MTTSNPTDLGKIYDSLWQEAAACFRTGTIQTDPFLLDRYNDRRLGLSVMGRPYQAVAAQIEAMLDHLKLLEPAQYFYQQNEFHLTILSLFTATENFAPYFANLAGYTSAVKAALTQAKRFKIQFKGITASKSAVMVQGFPQGPELDDIRERLRQELHHRGLGGELDKRYRLRTAHSTVMRFQAQPQNINRLIEALTSFRQTDFGEVPFNRLYLVKNDWYMSADRVEVLAEYQLN